MNNKTAVLLSNQKSPQRWPEIAPGWPVVQSASFMVPMFGKTVFQEPKKSTTATRHTNSIMAYSAKNKAANRKPEYSVWKPATSSDSASGISNGARFDSANEA